MLNYRIPFYGRYGSIKEINVENDNYYVTVYNGINSYRPYQMYPQNNSTKEMLEKNFFDNLEEYLTINKKKYDNLINDNRVIDNNYRPKLMALLTAASICGIALPIVGVITSLPVLFFLGLLTISASAPIISACCVTYKEYRFYKKAQKFIREYQFHEYNLENYKKSKTQEIQNKENNNVETISIAPKKVEVHENEQVKKLIKKSN